MKWFYPARVILAGMWASGWWVAAWGQTVAPTAEPTGEPVALELVEIQEPVPNDKCMECHGLPDTTRTAADGTEISLFVDEAIFLGSVHATNRCVDCHRDLEFRWEHPDDGHVALPVDCASCHAEQSATYNASVHALALQAGVLASATCKDCHGHHGMLGRSSIDSPVHFSHLVESCGQCHAEQAADWAESVHGQAAAKGHREAPTCIDCHSEHQIEDLRTASPMKISAQICGKCHASERLNTRFRMPAKQVESFFESYHGLAARGRSTSAANCASCHGWHRVFPSSDERSMVHADRLVETCGQCHPGIGVNFALGRVHPDLANGADIGTVANRWVRRAYIGLIVVVVGLLGLHNGAVWYRKVQAAYRSGNRTVVRMDRSQRRQHMILALSFIILAITGFALRFPDSWLSWALGTEEVRRWLHRISGLVLLGVGFWHIGYVMATLEGRRLIRDLQFRPQDWHDLRANVLHLRGRSPKRARFGRFGYPEKIEYWAVVWGIIIMGVTGLMIWLKVDVTRWAPRWVVDVAITIHYYEAILACLAILVWHIYHVLFDPDVYPGNFAWLDGRVTPEWQRHEHPLEQPASDASGPVSPGDGKPPQDLDRACAPGVAGRDGKSGHPPEVRDGHRPAGPIA